MPRIVIVDDEIMVRHALKPILERLMIDVVGEAGDAIEGIEIVLRAKPDVVLMDVRMPGMNGFEATREIKAAMPTVQVVFVTAYEDPHPTHSAAETGAYAYLLKDSSPELMRDVIHRAAQTKHQLDVKQRLDA